MAENDAASRSVSLDPQSLSSIKPAEFAGMNLAGRLAALPFMEPVKRRDCILECKDAGTLVQAIDVQDLFLTIKGVGLTDSAGMVAIMSSEQFRGCMDLDCWTRDEMVHDNAWGWLAALERSGMVAFSEKFYSLDFEFSISLLAGAAKVVIAKEDFDPDEGAPEGGFTPDGVHYIVFDCPDDRADLMKKLFVDMFGRDHDLYVRMLSAVRDSIPSQSQEEAFRWREGRLSDLGFPEYTEALKLYSRPEKKRDRFSHKALEPVGDNPPSFAITRYDRSSVLPSAVFERLGAKERASISAQAAYLVNALVVADRVDPGDVDALVSIMEKARGCVSIGLAELGANQAHTLASVPMFDIFRTGYAKLLDLQERARKLVDEHPLVAGDKKALRLDDLSRETIAALLAQRPMLYLGALDGKSEGAGSFMSVEDMSAVSKVLDSVDASAEIFGSILKIFKRDVAAIDIKNLNVASRDELTACRLLNTSIANKMLGRTLAPQPIEIPALGSLREAMFVKDGEKASFGADLEKTMTVIADAVESGKPGLGLAAKSLMESCLGELKDEIAHLAAIDSVKPGTIGAVLLRIK
jgi:hypothetical protein